MKLFGWSAMAGLAVILLPTVAAPQTLPEPVDDEALGFGRSVASIENAFPELDGGGLSNALYADDLTGELQFFLGTSSGLSTLEGPVLHPSTREALFFDPIDRSLSTSSGLTTTEYLIDRENSELNRSEFDRLTRLGLPFEAIVSDHFEWSTPTFNVQTPNLVGAGTSQINFGTSSVGVGWADDPLNVLPPQPTTEAIRVDGAEFESLQRYEEFVVGTLTYTNNESLSGTGIAQIDVVFDTISDDPIFQQTETLTVERVTTRNLSGNTSEQNADFLRILGMPELGSFHVLEGQTGSVELLAEFGSLNFTGFGETLTPTTAFVNENATTPVSDDFSLIRDVTELASTISISISNLIDGVDFLVFDGLEVYYDHRQFAAPGRHLGQNLPTVFTITERDENANIIGERVVEWFPVWPELPPNEIRFATISEPFTGLGFDIGEFEGQWQLISEADRCGFVENGGASLWEQPTEANDFTLEILYNDGPCFGSFDYEVTLFSPTETVFSDPLPNIDFGDTAPLVSDALFAELLQLVDPVNDIGSEPEVAPVPIPGSIWFLGAGLALLGLRRKA